MLCVINPQVAFTESSQNLLLAGFDVPQIGRQKAARASNPVLASTLINSVGIELTLIPAGKFKMGSIDGDRDEQPVHREKIDSAFYLGRFEITQKQWKKVMATEPWKGKRFTAVGDSYPASFISWIDAQQFVSRLNEREGCSCYHLPTERQWEYAARAGTSSRYSFGNNTSKLGDYAWYAGNSIGEQYAHPVGTKQPNPWGLYDMEGNVWEWMTDFHPQDIGPRIRGGSWGSPASSLRPANRSVAQQNHKASHIGFRISRSLE